MAAEQERKRALEERHSRFKAKRAERLAKLEKLRCAEARKAQRRRQAPHGGGAAAGEEVSPGGRSERRKEPLYKRMEKQFEEKVLMPELEARKRRLREIHAQFENPPQEQLEEHADEYARRQEVRQHHPLPPCLPRCLQPDICCAAGDATQGRLEAAA